MRSFPGPKNCKDMVYLLGNVRKVNVLLAPRHLWQSFFRCLCAMHDLSFINLHICKEKLHICTKERIGITQLALFSSKIGILMLQRILVEGHHLKSLESCFLSHPVFNNNFSFPKLWYLCTNWVLQALLNCSRQAENFVSSLKRLQNQNY